MSFFKTLFQIYAQIFNFKGTADRSTGLVWLTYHVIVVFTFGLLVLPESFRIMGFDVFEVFCLVIISFGFWCFIHCLPTLALLVRRFNHIGVPKRFVLFVLLNVITLSYFLGDSNLYIGFFVSSVVGMLELLLLLCLSCCFYRKQERNS